MGDLTTTFEGLGTAVIICIAVLIVACLIRSVLGPRVADRVVAVNSIGTMTIVVIAIFSVILDEAYLLDVCLIYAMISFLAVVVLTKIYTGVYREEKSEEESEEKSGKSAKECKEKSEESQGKSEEESEEKSGESEEESKGKSEGWQSKSEEISGKKPEKNSGKYDEAEKKEEV